MTKRQLHIICLFVTIRVFSQTSDCANTDFEYGNFANWKAAVSKMSDTIWVQGVVSNGINAAIDDRKSRHTIMTSAGGFDPNAINPISDQPDIPVLAPKGGNYSVRLGNSYKGIGAAGETEKLSRTFLISQENKGFTYQYAVVLEDPKGNHSTDEKPKFFIRLLDSSGTVLPGPCASYQVYAGSDPTFISDTVRGIEYKKWTTVGVDLSPYIGQTITIEFRTSDCTKPPSGGHFGYAYVDAKCSALEIELTYCPGDDEITLSAPEGYVTYSWSDPAGKPIGNTQKITVKNPKMGDEYSVSMKSVTGCETFIQNSIKFKPHEDTPNYLLTQNVITPNEDKQNDFFITNQFKYTREFNLKVFNRWGELVYETNDAEKGWDGKLKDGKVIEGVYYWISTYISRCSKDDIPIPSSGFIHVFR